MIIRSYNLDTGTSEPVSVEGICLFCTSYEGSCIKKRIGVSSLYHCNSHEPNGEEIKTEETFNPNSGKPSLKIIGRETLFVPKELIVLEELLHVAPAQV